MRPYQIPDVTIGIRRGSCDARGRRFRYCSEMRIYTPLALAGALPFAACALLPVAGVTVVEPFGRLDTVLATYGLAIICFLAGTHWATYLFNGPVTRANLYLVSNAVLLATWFSYLLAEINGALITQIVALAILFLVDRRLYLADVIPADYVRARAVATGIATVSIAGFMLVSK